jgi:hypothetical protein
MLFAPPVTLTTTEADLIYDRLRTGIITTSNQLL